jgi:hypothetical protein
LKSRPEKEQDAISSTPTRRYLIRDREPIRCRILTEVGRKTIVNGDGTGLLLYTGRKTSVAMRSTCAGKVQVRLVMNLGSKVA